MCDEISFFEGVDIMPVDKSWINLSNSSCEEYVNEVIEFVEYAFQRVKEEDMKIKCPCNDCNNMHGRTQVEVIGDLIWKGMTNDYTRWHLHGEGNSKEDEEDSDEEDTMYLM